MELSICVILRRQDIVMEKNLLLGVVDHAIPSRSLQDRSRADDDLFLLTRKGMRANAKLKKNYFSRR